MRTSYAALKKLGLIVAIFSAAACDAGRVTDPPVAQEPVSQPPVAQSVVVSPTTAEMAVGDIIAIKATAIDQNGQVISGRDVSWTTSSGSRVRVSSGGTLEGVTTGEDTVFATMDGKKGKGTVRVFEPRVSVVLISLSPSTVEAGQSAQASATLFRSSGTEITGNVYWTSSNSSVATIDQSGRIVALNAGSTTIQAVSEGKVDSEVLTVEPANDGTAISSVVVTAPTSHLYVGKHAQLSAVVRDAKGRTVENASVSWKSSNGSIAQVSGSGDVVGLAAGSASFTATIENVSGETSLSVTLLPVNAISLTVQPGSISTGSTAQAIATAFDADGDVITGRAVSYLSSNTSVATVNASGVVLAVGVGSSIITAIIEGRTSQAPVTVAPVAEAVASVYVLLTSQSLAVGGSAQATATPRNSSGSALVGKSVSWSSSNTGVATVSASGAVSAVGIGSAEIRATVEGVTGSATLPVNAVVSITGVTVTPALVSINTGGTQQFAAVAAYSDGSFSPVGVTWSATGGSINSQGGYTAGQLAGQFMVIAACSCGVADTSHVSIVAPSQTPTATLVSVRISPEGAQLLTGGSAQFVPLGIESGSSTPVSTAVFWTATGGTIDQTGKYVAGNTAGEFVVRAASTVNVTLRDSVVVVISAPASPPPPSQELAALTLDPDSKSLNAGDSFRFAANGWYSGASEPHDTPVTWSATGGTIDQQGNFTAGQSNGTYVVRVQSQLVSWRKDSSIVTVAGADAPPAEPPAATPTVSAFSMTPSSASLLAGESRQFTTVSTWTDGANRSVAVTYSASGGNVSSAGFYTAGSVAGMFRVIASCDCGLADTSTVSVTVPTQLPPPPPPPSGINPSPGADAQILIDTRAGAAHSIQSSAVTSFAGALRLADPHGTGSAYNGTWGFTTNMDGSGTRAFRLEHTGVGTNFRDGGGLLSMRLSDTPTQAPKEVYVQFKHRMGRTATGGGIGEIGAFDITNENDSFSSNAGRKFLLLCRPTVADPGGCGGRVDHTWSGPAPARAATAIVHPNGFDRSLGPNMATVVLENLHNSTIIFTSYFRAASSQTAADGIVRFWYNGVLVGEHTGLSLGAEGVAGLGIPTVFRSPKFDMTEYFWDFVVWTPN